MIHNATPTHTGLKLRAFMGNFNSNIFQNIKVIQSIENLKSRWIKTHNVTLGLNNPNRIYYNSTFLHIKNTTCTGGRENSGVCAPGTDRPGLPSRLPAWGGERGQVRKGSLGLPATYENSKIASRHRPEKGPIPRDQRSNKKQDLNKKRTYPLGLTGKVTGC